MVEGRQTQKTKLFVHVIIKLKPKTSGTPPPRAQNQKHYTQLAITSFDQMLDLTAEVHLCNYHKINRSIATTVGVSAANKLDSSTETYSVQETRRASLLPARTHTPPRARVRPSSWGRMRLNWSPLQAHAFLRTQVILWQVAQNKSETPYT